MKLKLFLSRLNPFKKKFVVTKSAPEAPIELDAKTKLEFAIVEAVEGSLFHILGKLPNISHDQTLLDVDLNGSYQATCCCTMNGEPLYLSVNISEILLQQIPIDSGK